MNEAVRHIDTAFRHLTLALDKIDEAQTNDTADARELRVKQNAIRAIRSTYLIPLHDHFQVSLEEEYKSPRDLVSVLVPNNDATIASVKKLFEKQYEFQWHTETGDPEQFSFYGFCQDVVEARHGAEGENVMTYATRRSHVISTLYSAQNELREIRDLTYRELCPPIYVRTQVGVTWRWKKWMSNQNNNKFYVAKHNTNIHWITNADLKKHINENSELNESGNLPNEKGHLYMAVFEQEDSDQQGENPPFRTQVYVGQAKNGIKERWTGGGTSHCKKMEFARDVMCDMLSYDPTALRSEQLVDLRLLLHKAWNGNAKSGLFIMGQFINPTAPNDPIPVEEEKKLKNAEQAYINGNRIDVSENGSETETSITADEDWKPNDMNYGMNGS